MTQPFVHPQGICESEDVGEGTTIWAFSHVLPGASIGRNVNINDHVFVENDVVIGDRVTVKSGVQVWDGTELQDDVFIGPNVTFTNDRFPRSKQYPESFDPAVPENLVYSGSRKLTELHEETGLTIGKLVLSPTRTYAPIIRQMLQQYRSQIHGMVHCSGGAQTKVLHFVENKHVKKDNLFPVPPLFRLIQQESNTSPEEMYRVFNMGHRMELYVPENIAKDLIQISESFGVKAQIVGRVEDAEKNKLTLKGEFGELVY